MSDTPSPFASAKAALAEKKKTPVKSTKKSGSGKKHDQAKRSTVKPAAKQSATPAKEAGAKPSSKKKTKVDEARFEYGEDISTNLTLDDLVDCVEKPRKKWQRDKVYQDRTVVSRSIGVSLPRGLVELSSELIKGDRSRIMRDALILHLIPVIDKKRGPERIAYKERLRPIIDKLGRENFGVSAKW